VRRAADGDSSIFRNSGFFEVRGAEVHERL